MFTLRPTTKHLNCLEDILVVKAASAWLKWWTGLN